MQGEIPLNAATCVVSADFRSLHGGEFGFAITTYQRTYNIWVDTRDEQLDWIGRIQELMETGQKMIVLEKNGAILI